MVELANKNYPGRVEFPEGKQGKFILFIQTKLNIGVDELAHIAGVCPRTMRDWRREKFSISHESLKILCRKANVSIPKSIKIKDPFWYVNLGAKTGWIALIDKYGKIPVSETYRKKKWYEWWEKEGKFKKHPIINVCKTFNKPKSSEKLAEFFGIMMGDGGMSKGQICITLHHKDDLEFSNYVTKLITMLFKVTPSVINIAKHSVNRILVSRSGLVKYLNSLGLVIGNKIKQKIDIPDWIKKDKIYLKACIRGLVDTDGCIIQHRYKVNGKQYSYKKVAFTTMSSPLRESVFKALKSWNFNPRISQNRDVRLESKRDIKMYFKTIGSHNPKHLKKYLN